MKNLKQSLMLLATLASGSLTYSAASPKNLGTDAASRPPVTQSNPSAGASPKQSQSGIPGANGGGIYHGGTPSKVKSSVTPSAPKGIPGANGGGIYQGGSVFPLFQSLPLIDEHDQPIGLIYPRLGIGFTKQPNKPTEYHLNMTDQAPDPAVASLYTNNIAYVSAKGQKTAIHGITISEEAQTAIVNVYKSLMQDWLPQSIQKYAPLIKPFLTPMA